MIVSKLGNVVVTHTETMNETDNTKVTIISFDIGRSKRIEYHRAMSIGTIYKRNI